MNSKPILLLLSIMLVSFNGKEKHQIEIKSIESEIKKSIVESKSDNTIFESKHCFVKDVYEKDGKYYIIADYVDFLTEDKAVERAKINGDADYDISKSGDTIYFVYNDYYVSNINPKLRTIELEKEIKIELLDFSENSNENGYRIVPIKEYIELYKNHSLVILKMENGICREIKEQFTP